ncbi:MAG: YitT family protein [Bacteroidales bacterium]|nr:YitT family protein [Bacteroidales bacterium]MDD4001948.1 YitT family protein [Bacteroidales bacterium]MDD4529457.1 YitT family protein [Bacteroidales bacterium]MDD4829185.1 YitT family protein [Bacteroidales bacterium]
MKNSIQSIKETSTGRLIWKYFMIAFGIFLYAFAWSVFLIPKNIVGGGVVGIASIIYIITGFPVGISNFAINLILLLIGFKILGGKFGFDTIIGSLIASSWFLLLQQVIGIEQYFDLNKFDPFMSSIIGGAISGLGIGLCFSNGGNSGGSDVIALIYTKFRNVSPGSVIFVVDAIVIVSSIIIPENSIESIIYGFIVMAVFTYSIDLVVEGNKQSYQIMVFSQKNREIADLIGKDIKKGVTLLNGEGWYSKQDQKVLMVIARKAEKVEIMRAIKRVDPSAFISVAKTQGVFGKNFDDLKS